MNKPNVSTHSHAFFVGIKGVGMTSLALAMQDAGWEISGSDTQEVFITDPVLSARNIQVYPINKQPPSSIDLVVYSGAYTPPHTAIKTLSLAEALAEFVQDRRVIAVAGVGGKTTTSAMLAALFHSADRDVGYYLGTSSILGLAAPGKCGSDPLFVVEADEYAISKTDSRPKFALLSPTILITTNILHDHPDIYPDKASTLAAFRSLVERIPATGAWIYNSADPLSQQIYKGSLLVCQLIPYSLELPPLDLGVFGEQNQLDAQAAVLAATFVGLSKDLAVKSIKSYRGAGRRQEFHGEVAGRFLYDDYGHHPQEIKLTIESFKTHFPTQRLLLVFESHTFSRTEALLKDFAEALRLADLTFIMPIFASAREQAQPHSITPASFAAAVSPATLPLTWDTAAEQVWAESRPGDIILTMGAGFVYKLHTQFKQYAN